MRLLVIVCIQVLLSGLAWSAQNVYVKHPDNAWAVKMKLDGFKLEQFSMSPGGQAVSKGLTKKTDGYIVSLFVAHIPEDADPTAKGCRDLYASRSPFANIPAFAKKQVEGRPGFTFFIENLQIGKKGESKKIDQRVFSAFDIRDGYCVNAQVAKVLYKPEDDATIMAMLKSFSFADGYEARADELMVYAKAHLRDKSTLKARFFFRSVIDMLSKSRKQSERETSVQAYRGLLIAHAAEGDTDGARRVSEESLTAFPGNAQLLYDRSAVEAGAGEATSAVEFMRKAFAVRGKLKFDYPLDSPLFKPIASDEGLIALDKELRKRYPAAGRKKK